MKACSCAAPHISTVFLKLARQGGRKENETTHNNVEIAEF